MQLGRTSRRAAALSGLGAAVMFVSLALSTLALRDKISTVTALETQRRDLNDAVAKLNSERAKAERDLADTKDKLAAAKRQAETAQENVADLNAALEPPAMALDPPATPAPPALVPGTPPQPLSARERARSEWRAGQAARQKNQVAVAERHFQAAIAADPGYAPAYNSLGRLAAAHGDASAAEKLYRESLVHDPSYRAALYNLATLSEAMHGAKAALLPAQALLKLQPSDARSQNLVARLSAAAAM
jgi:tetratricopeptide (TPR) repeat protein